MENIGIRIYNIRNVRGLTQTVVAEKLQITVDEYDKIEKNEKELDINLSIKLSDIFNVSLEYILKGTVNTKEDQDVYAKIELEQRQNKMKDEVKNAYSKKVYDKWKDLIYKLHFTSEDAGLRNPRNKTIYAGALLKLDDFDFISELIKNLDVRYRDGYGFSNENKLKRIDDMIIKGNSNIINTNKKSFDINTVYSSQERISSDDLILLLLENKITDKKFIDLLCRKDPVALLNKYYLTDKHIQEKEDILKCLNSGGYVLKVVDFSYYTDYSKDEYGETVRVNEFGKDVLGTFLLKEYCMKK